MAPVWLDSLWRDVTRYGPFRDGVMVGLLPELMHILLRPASPVYGQGEREALHHAEPYSTIRHLKV
jgi:hypothetical protein